MKSKVIVYFSPKTAGASSVSLNAACLQALARPDQKIGLLEVSPLASQSTFFPTEHPHHWGELLPFFRTPDWQPKLLAQAAFDLKAEVLWSPNGKNFPVFKPKQALAWLELLLQRYDVLHVDLNQTTPSAWQQFWLGQATQVVGVVTPDPLGLQAWQNWSSQYLDSAPLGWVLNQASAPERSRLSARFASEKFSLLGVLRQESKTFWSQTYQAFPVVWQRRSGFKKDLAELLTRLEL